MTRMTEPDCAVMCNLINTHTQDQCEWHRMTRMTGPDCAIMGNLVNKHTHTHTHTPSIPVHKAYWVYAKSSGWFLGARNHPRKAVIGKKVSIGLSSGSPKSETWTRSSVDARVALRTVIYLGSVSLLFRSPYACACRREQIEDLMGINKDDDETSAMQATLAKASKEMKMLVDRQDQQLKVGLTTSEKQIGQGCGKQRGGRAAGAE